MTVRMRFSEDEQFEVPEFVVEGEEATFTEWEIDEHRVTLQRGYDNAKCNLQYGAYTALLGMLSENLSAPNMRDRLDCTRQIVRALWQKCVITTEMRNKLGWTEATEKEFHQQLLAARKQAA